MTMPARCSPAIKNFRTATAGRETKCEALLRSGPWLTSRVTGPWSWPAASRSALKPRLWWKPCRGFCAKLQSSPSPRPYGTPALPHWATRTSVHPCSLHPAPAPCWPLLQPPRTQHAAKAWELRAGVSRAPVSLSLSQSSTSHGFIVVEKERSFAGLGSSET